MRKPGYGREGVTVLSGQVAWKEVQKFGELGE